MNYTINQGDRKVPVEVRGKNNVAKKDTKNANQLSTKEKEVRDAAVKKIDSLLSKKSEKSEPRYFGGKGSSDNKDSEKRSYSSSEGRRFGGEKRFGDRPGYSNSSRFGGDRRFGDRPSYNRSSEGRPTGNRFSNERSGDSRFSGERRFGDKPGYGDRVGLEKKLGERPSYNRSSDDRSSDNRFSGERKFGDRPSYNNGPGRFGGERRFGDRPGHSSGNRFGDRPSYNRSSDGRSGDSRFGGERKFGDRPSYNNSGKFGDRPSYNRSSDDNRSGERRFGDRPSYNRSSDGRSGDNRFGGERRFGDRPSYNRTSDGRSGENRFSGERKFGDRPSYNNNGPGRFGGERRFGDRPGYSSGNRFGDRPSYNRSSDGRSGYGPRNLSNEENRNRKNVLDRFNKGGNNPSTARRGSSGPGGAKKTEFGQSDIFEKRTVRRNFSTPVKRNYSDRRGDERKSRFRGSDQNSNEKFSHRFLGQIHSADDVDFSSSSYFKKPRDRKKQKDNVIRVAIIPQEGISLIDLSTQIAVRSKDIKKKLEEFGVKNSNEMIDSEVASLIVESFGHKHKIERSEMNIEPEKGELSEHKRSAPVVTIVGHVDHGKTSLLDSLRKTNVTSKEAGGITQSIGASQIFLKDKEGFVTFVDTPGHEAFGSMRARGVKLTDIVVLVVSSDDGIKEQTVEAIDHIKAFNAPLIVCYTKIDKGRKNIDKIRQMLISHDIVVESMGGETLEVEVSAHTGENLDKFLETILMQAEIMDLKSHYECKASGIVIESRLDKHLGPVSSILIKNGKLKLGDAFVVGNTYGKARIMNSVDGKKIKEALPSMPVEIMGLKGVPFSGDELIVVENEKKARAIAEYRENNKDKSKSNDKKEVDILDYFKSEENFEMNFVIKADSFGSLEALEAAVNKIEFEKLNINIVRSGTGDINENDIMIAKSSGSIIIAFNVKAVSGIQKLAKKERVKIKTYSIIYEVLDYINNFAEHVLAPKEEEVSLGMAFIKAIFEKKKLGTIAGCEVEKGVVKLGSFARVIRKGEVIYTGKINSLKQRENDKTEMESGQECGIIIDEYTDYAIGDKIESFIIKKKNNSFEE
ncbi:translation initiation factor IF-2 [Candidatus Nesciobacter abundans]|uniref:Translation initiation factor IF-2 n=1 Tax=Candidatus Nesciobacter abundans TaxID=2601668 RepID=A0A5C0UG62_9PROT|nr:translation initiation factor IF-2 [Candidatus Nesciobacter abundans]QEK39085.1 translation initiation factor IF-2 [Candidatus Nesciobacter abundans]